MLAKSIGLSILVGTVAVSLVFDKSAEAAVISGQLFNTGVDATGAVLPFFGASDPHYTVVENDNQQAVTYFNDAYLPNNSGSAWIWQTGTGQPGGVTRTFRTMFNLSGYDHTSAAISGLWGADNIGVDILINGVGTSNFIPSGSGAFSQLTAFNITSGFVAGQNVLSFVVQDLGGPGAFRVDNIQLTADLAADSTAIPTPALLPSLIGMGAATLRKRRQEAEVEA